MENGGETVTGPAHRFEEEILPYLDQMYGPALALTRNPSDAEDLVQDAFLQAYQGFGTYRPGSNPRAWLRRILTNTFVSTYRKSSRDLQHIGQPLPADWQLNQPGGSAAEPPGAGPLTAGYSPSAESEALRRLEREEAYALLDSLPAPQRTSVYLADVVGLTSKEIAQITDVPQNTVLSRIRRGRARLRDQVEQSRRASRSQGGQK